MKYISRPTSAAVKDIDIANILCQKYRYHINIGHGDVNPPLTITPDGANNNERDVMGDPLSQSPPTVWLLGLN